jgi:hypothetical protein
VSVDNRYTGVEYEPPIENDSAKVYYLESRVRELESENAKLRADLERLAEAAKEVVSETSHSKFCYAIHGPENETWLVEEDCNCEFKNLKSALAALEMKSPNGKAVKHKDYEHLEKALQKCRAEAQRVIDTTHGGAGFLGDEDEEYAPYERIVSIIDTALGK